MAANAPTTTEGRVNRSAFQLGKFRDRYAPLPKPVERELRGRIEQVLVPIRVAPRSWMAESFGSAPAAGDRRRILESLKEVEIWSCLSEACRGCPGSDGTGCALGMKASGGTGVVLLVHPCLYGQGKCRPGSNTDPQVWAEKVVATTAFYKSGRERTGDNLERAQKASAEWIRSTSQSVNRLLGACPGPYPTEAMAFLLKHDAASVPNPAIRKCGEAYLREFEGLAGRCKSLAKEHAREWDEFKKTQLRVSADVVRIDDFARGMLCRKKSARTIFTAFAGKPTLLIADGACEGERAVAPGEFLRDALPKSLRAKLDATGCLPAPEAKDSGSSGVGGMSSGSSDVQLVD